MVRFTAVDCVPFDARGRKRPAWRSNLLVSEKKTRAGEGCHGPLRQFDEAIARYVNGDLNCWACTRHWMRATQRQMVTVHLRCWNTQVNCPKGKFQRGFTARLIAWGQMSRITGPEPAGATRARWFQTMYFLTSQIIFLLLWYFFYVYILFQLIEYTCKFLKEHPERMK